MSPRGTFGFSKKRAKILRTIETVIPRSTEVSLHRLYSRDLCAPCTDRLDCMSRTAILVACKVPQRPSTGLPAKACQRPISVYRGSASHRIAAHRSASRSRYASQPDHLWTTPFWHDCTSYLPNVILHCKFATTPRGTLGFSIKRAKIL